MTRPTVSTGAGNCHSSFRPVEDEFGESPDSFKTDQEPGEDSPVTSRTALVVILNPPNP